MVKGVFNDENLAKYMCRELKILRHLSGLNESMYSVKLYDAYIDRNLNQ